ncbi:MAG: DUF4190 domain-containing protein, partial [Sedimentisphaerales bacterium]|nr:DUF4190 domain-containing protein [Sedimentisphaerales bacterium]
TVCAECGKELTMGVRQVSTAAIISLVLGIVGWAAWGLPALVGIVFGIVALYKIKKANGLLVGKGYAWIGLVLAVAQIALIGIMLFGVMRWNTPEYKLMCGSNLSGIGKAMMCYGNDYKEKLPTGDNWCDVLIKYADVSPNQFVCKESDAIKGESSYAMNRNVAGKEMTYPADIVVLFETDYGKDANGRTEPIQNRDGYKEFYTSNKKSDNEKVYKTRWNQAGGAEMLTAEHHKGKGSNILFGDMHVEFVEKERFGLLRWIADGNDANDQTYQKKP